MSPLTTCFMAIALAALQKESPDSAVEGYHEIEPGTRLELTLGAEDPRLKDGSPSRTFHLRSDFDGRLQVWARGEDADPFLSIRRTSILQNVPSVVADDDGGGGTTACVGTVVAREDPVEITIAVRGEGRVELVVVGAPETDATKAAAQNARLVLGEAQRLLPQGEFDAAQERIRAALAELESVPHPERSVGLASTARSAAATATRAGALEDARRAWKVLLDHHDYLLPPDHALALRDREEAGRSYLGLGAYEEARALLASVVDVRAKRLPEDDDLVLRARETLSDALAGLGDVAGARGELSRVMTTLSQKLPPTHPHVVRVRERLERLPPPPVETPAPGRASKTPR